MNFTYVTIVVKNVLKRDLANWTIKIVRVDVIMNVAGGINGTILEG